MEHSGDLMTGSELGNIVSETSAIVTRGEISIATPGVVALEEKRQEDSVQNVSYVQNRDYYMESVEWNATQAAGTVLKAYECPKNFFEEMKKTSAASFVEQFAYMRPRVRVTLQVLAPRVANGKLLMSGYYGDITNSLKEEFRVQNLCTLTQPEHVILNLASGNSVSFDIEYNHFLSYIPTTEGSNDKGGQSMYKLFLMVFSPTTENVSVNVFYRLYMNEPNAFRGPLELYNRDNEYQGVVEDVALGAVGGAGSALLKNFNRDLPNKDTTGVRQMIPMAAHGMACGTGEQESTHMLRLTAPVYQVPTRGTEGISTSFTELASRPAMYRYFTIEKTTTDVAAIPVTPIISDVPVAAAKETKKLALYRYPPISVAAACHCYWKGAIRYRFDFSNNSFQMGRIIVAFVPNVGVDEAKALTTSQLTNCYYKVVELKDVNSFEFDAPYTAPRPWFPCDGSKYGVEQFRQCSTGTIIVRMLSKLMTAANAASNIMMHVFMSAGPDFEVAVPRAPALLAVQDRSCITMGAGPKVSPGYTPCYIDTWRNAVDISGNSIPVLRYGPGSDHVSIFLNCDKKTLYSLTVPEGLNPMMMDVGGPKKVDYLIPLQCRDDYIYMVPFWSWSAAVTYITTGDTGSIFSRFKAKSVYYPVDKYTIAATTKYRGEAPPELESDISDLGEEAVEFQGDEVIASQRLGGLTNYTSLLSFGESFDDIKDHMRRKIKIFELDMTNRAAKSFRVGQAFARFPCRFDAWKGVTEDNTTMHENFMRTGVIGLLSSGFTFARGSLRYTIILNGVTRMKVGVYHVPDHYVVEYKYQQDMRDLDIVVDTGYAGIVIDPQVNPCAEIVVPYYSPYERILINFKGSAEIGNYAKDAATLGDLMFTVVSDTDIEEMSKLVISIYLGYGDDVELSGFRGFPALARSADIPIIPTKFKVEYQGLSLIHM